MDGFLALFLLIILAFGLLIAIAYPKVEGGDVTFFGSRPNYFLQKMLELLLLPIFLGILFLIFQ
ncbi:TPA: hypothetical protein U1366_000712 [Streptococcus suis]|nr:hypothetical protein [Streptococcus suis]